MRFSLGVLVVFLMTGLGTAHAYSFRECAAKIEEVKQELEAKIGELECKLGCYDKYSGTGTLTVAMRNFCLSQCGVENTHTEKMEEIKTEKQPEEMIGDLPAK